MDSEFKAPPALTPPVRPAADAAAVIAPDAPPTIRDHAARLDLAPWQIAATVARLHGEHDADGKRVFPAGVDLNTRMSVEDFAAAADTALHGRI